MYIFTYASTIIIGVCTKLTCNTLCTSMTHFYHTGFVQDCNNIIMLMILLVVVFIPIIIGLCTDNPLFF